MLLTFQLILKQVRRLNRSSVTGEQKKYMGATDQFYPKLREERPKKGLHPGRFPFLGAQVLLRGHVYFLAGRGAAESNGGDLAFCPQI